MKVCLRSQTDSFSHYSQNASSVLTQPLPVASPDPSPSQAWPFPLPPLVDRFGRVHTSIRISVTDRCNIRCRYCMPDGEIAFLSQERLLSFESIAKLIGTLSRAGVTKVRLTGGEPLLRPQLFRLIEQIRAVDRIEEITLTTNGMLLRDQLKDLGNAGLQRVNISLDTLLESNFERISRRKGLDRVLQGIEAAVEQGFQVRLNALIIRSLNLEEVPSLVAFAGRLRLPIRFIEFMPLDADRQWKRDDMVSGAELRQFLEKKFSRLQPIPRNQPSQPATDYEFEGGGVVGFIDSVSQPFCGSCNRLRLTAEGKLRNCLFGQQEWDVEPWLRNHSQFDEAALIQQVRDCVFHKHQSHGISESGFKQPDRAMYQIGG